jgi:UDP-glucose 4-epimerase
VRVVVLGASGNVGTSLLALLAADAGVDSILGVARRLPELDLPKTEWATADIAADDLVPLLRGADAVVHLAWTIQPSRDLSHLWRINVEGSTRVFRAAGEAGVPALVYASSVGAYSRGPKDRVVDESWPTNGIPTSFYGRHKAEVERRLDRFERERPETRVVRLRPGLIFKREAAEGIRRLFVGPFLVNPLVRSCDRRSSRSSPTSRASASRPCTRTTWERPTTWRRRATSADPSTSRPSPSSTRPSSDGSSALVVSPSRPARPAGSPT